MAQYALVTRFAARPGQRKELTDILVKAHHIVSSAKGCKLFAVNHDVNHDDLIWVNEIWDTQEDHAISLTLDGCKELILEAKHLMNGDPVQNTLKPITA